MGTEYSWREPLGLHRLEDTVEVAERLMAGYECTTPAYGAPGYAHCAACCYGTGINASSMEEFETAQVLAAVPSLVAEIIRLRKLEIQMDRPNPTRVVDNVGRLVKNPSDRESVAQRLDVNPGQIHRVRRRWPRRLYGGPSCIEVTLRLYDESES